MGPAGGENHVDRNVLGHLILDISGDTHLEIVGVSDGVSVLYLNLSELFDNVLRDVGLRLDFDLSFQLVFELIGAPIDFSHVEGEAKVR